MKIFFVTDHLLHDWQRQRIKSLIDLLEQQSSFFDVQAHCITRRETEADIFLFVTHVDGFEPISLYPTIRSHTLVQDFPERCFMWSQKDFPIPLLPGLYESLHKHLFDPQLHRTFSYSDRPNHFIEKFASASERDTGTDFFVSFVGSITNTVRRRILKLKFDRSDILLRQTPIFWNDLLHEDRLHEEKIRYAEILCRSKFVLCPRGKGVASYRLFETMQASRVPVIISDGWVAPNDCEWEKFSIRVDEKDIEKIPEILEMYETQAPEMGAYAQRVWERKFSPAAKLNTIGDTISSIRKSMPSNYSSRYRWQWLVYMLRYTYRHNRERLKRQTIKIVLPALPKFVRTVLPSEAK